MPANFLSRALHSEIIKITVRTKKKSAILAKQIDLFMLPGIITGTRVCENPDKYRRIVETLASEGGKVIGHI